MYFSRSGAIEAVRASEVFLQFDDADAVAVLPDFFEAELAEVGGSRGGRGRTGRAEARFRSHGPGRRWAGDVILDVQPWG